MKHTDATVRLAEMLRELALTVDPGVQSLCVDYLEAVLRRNETVNLTAVTDSEMALRLHVLDSLAALPEVNAAPGGLLVDLGTGGGFPGVPLALASGREALLLDSVKKKVSAVEECLADAGIADNRFRFSWSRAEELALAAPAAAAVVVARAVAELPVLVELVAPLLRSGGWLIALKGDISKEELERGDAAAEVVGLGRRAIRNYLLPRGDESRSVIVYERVGDPRVPLPRRAGMASKRPLA